MSFYTPRYTKCHVASHQQTDSQQVGGSVCFEETVQSWGFLPGGFSHHRVSLYTKHGCVCLSPPMCMCATKEKEHWGQLYLCCLVVVSWQCPSHHSMGLDVGSDRSDLHATSPSQDTQTIAYTQTYEQQTQTDRSTDTSGNSLAYMETQHWFRQNMVATLDKKYLLRYTVHKMS